jgi:hypothetical protein
VDDGTTAADTEVSPRQQLVSTPFALRAKFAESLGANGVNTITALDNGNVGVGTATPGTKLDVVGGVRASAADGFSFGTGGDADGGLVSPADGVVALRTNSSERLRIDSSGNVGIGTTAPGFKLDVQGTLRATGALTAGSVTATGAITTNFGTATHSAPGAYLEWDKDNSTRATYLLNQRGTGAGGLIFGEVDSANSITERMRLNSSGFLGVGTASPTARLDVAGTAVATGLTVNGNATVTGTATLANVTASGSASVASLSVSGAASAANLNLSGNITTAGAAYFLDSNHSIRAVVTKGVVISTYQVQDGVFLQETTGNVGIGYGQNAPAAKLDVNGSVNANGVNSNGVISVTNGGTRSRQAGLSAEGNGATVNFGVNDSSSNRFGGSYASADQGGFLRVNSASGNNLFGFHGRAAGATTAPAELVSISSAGRVGIGTTSPSVPLHVMGGPNHVFNREAEGNITGWGDAQNLSTTNEAVGILVEQAIVARKFFVNSDARIKAVVGRSSGESDLALLGRIEITDYTYRDRLSHGGRPQKKVIAQQVEAVFPQAVTRGTGVVPDIYRRAGIAADGWIDLPTDLRVGERVRLVADGTAAVHEVLEVEARRFRTAFVPTGAEVFVYGREVPDFRSVDYEAIAMLNVSATQQLKRDHDAAVAALRTENAELRDRLAAVEKLLRSGSTVMARPAVPAANGTGQE